MKQKLLTLALLFITAVVMGQPIAYPVPDITHCGPYSPAVNSIDITGQIPIVLGNQNPQLHTVTFHLWESSAQAGTVTIPNPASFTPLDAQPVVYIRVQDTNGQYAITSFNVIFSNPNIPSQQFISACETYSLPVPELGLNYYTAPNGGGTQIPPGFAFTQSTIIYKHGIIGNCPVNVTINLQVANIPQNNPAPYVICTASGAPGVFDLTAISPSLSGQHPWAWVSFHLTEADANADDNPIANPAAYMAASAMQTIHARIMIDGSPICAWIKPLILATETCTTNSISGTVRFDADGGGCGSANDIPAQGIPVYNIAGPNTYQTVTDANGDYSFNGMPNVSNVVLIMQAQLPYAVTPAVHQVTMPAIATGKDFCLSVQNPVQDMQVSLVPITQARPGFPVSYSLVYTNAGTLPATGSMTVYFPITKMTYVSSGPAMLVNGNALTLAYTNLQPLQSRYVNITFQVLPPQIVPLGDVLTSAAVIILNGDDSNMSNNTAVVNQTVVNSYDPNDISVLEGEYITEAQADGYLHYTIRFQNIGNADALRVKIINPLDGQLDFGTLQPLSASHPYTIQRINDQLTILLDNINLPGSQVNEPGSHGYITYRIKPNAMIQVGDVIGNNASIYFDFNDPINTNTVTTTVQAPAGMQDFAENGFSMYPNPANGLVTIKLSGINDADVWVTDVLGKTVLTSKMASAEHSIDVTGLNSGLYFVKVNANGHSATKKLVVK